MHYRTIPGTDVRVSLLGFGNFTFGSTWWTTLDDASAVNLQNLAVDLGVNFFDTAPAYGDGRAEQLLRQTIRYAGRDKLILSTKFGYDVTGHPPTDPSDHRERPQNFSGNAIRRELELSLRRLDVEMIDLYQAHNVKLPQMQDDMFATLERLREEGKIRYWGAALGPAIGWREEGLLALEKNAATVQTVFNLYEQDPGRWLCDAAARHGRGGIIARVPTNSGILDEEFPDDAYQFPAWDHRKFRDRHWLIQGLKKNDILRPLARSCGLSLRHFALAWLAGFDSLVSIEPNIVNEADLRDYAAGCAGPALPVALRPQLDVLYANDFYLGSKAHPCDLKSSVTPDGKVRSDIAVA